MLSFMAYSFFFLNTTHLPKDGTAHVINQENTPTDLRSPLPRCWGVGVWNFTLFRISAITYQSFRKIIRDLGSCYCPAQFRQHYSFRIRCQVHRLQGELAGPCFLLCSFWSFGSNSLWEKHDFIRISKMNITLSVWGLRENGLTLV